MTEQISGKLPVEHKPPAPDVADRAAVMRLGAAAAEAFAIMSEAGARLAEHFARLTEIAERMRPLVAAEEAISDGPGDDEQA